jgi:hypothetical protein
MGTLREFERSSSGRPCGGSGVAMVERVMQNDAHKTKEIIGVAKAADMVDQARVNCARSKLSYSRVMTRRTKSE